MKIGVPGADSADTMFTHQNGRVHVMHLVAANIGQLAYRLFKHSRVTVCREEKADPRRGEDPADEASCLCRGPRHPERAPARTDPQKLINTFQVRKEGDGS